MQILSTLVRADAGDARVAGHDPARDPDAVRRAIGMTCQFSAVDGLLTGEENLALMADLSHLERVEGRRRIATYYHDVPPELAQEALRRVRDHPSERSMREPWPLSAWPDVPTRVLLCRDDRFFPAPFLRRVARERLGITPDEIDGGHCVGLSRPAELAERLESYLVPHTAL